MAAAWLNHLADPAHARAISAGTSPAERIHPEVMAVMKEVGIDLSGAAPQKLTVELARGADLLVTMGCGDKCPYVPGLKVEDWPLEDIGWATARRGAVNSYRRARKAGSVAVERPTAENLHEWRKRVKDHWYHQRLLEEAWPTVLAAQAEEAHALSDALGGEHDLTVLVQRLTGSDGPLSDLGVDGDEVLELVARRRAELAEAATQLGRRIFAESPKAYGRRLKRYVRAAAVEEPLAQAA